MKQGEAEKLRDHGKEESPQSRGVLQYVLELATALSVAVGSASLYDAIGLFKHIEPQFRWPIISGVCVAGICIGYLAVRARRAR